MEYIRICQGISDKGTLLPTNEDIYKHLNLNKECYRSAFLYTEEHYQQFKKNGSVAGINNTRTPLLYWDFDSSENLELAKNDVFKLCSRLHQDGIPTESIGLFFSGKKGFQVEVEVSNSRFSPEEVKNICLSYGKDLSTLDTQIYNANRILRVPLSRHKDTGLFKTPLDFSALPEASIDEIKTEAKTQFPMNAFRSLFAPLVKDVPAIEKARKQVVTMKQEPIAKLPFDVSQVDWSKKPRQLTPEKYLIELGFFEEGNRSHALMVLASTYKFLGMNETQSYYALKAAADLQSQRTDGDKFPKEEIWNNIIRQVYSPTWTGGNYSAKTSPLLAKLSQLVPLSVRYKDAQDVVTVTEGLNSFISYAERIEENSIRFGLKELDEGIGIQTGHLIGLLAGPGIGKTSLAVTVLNNTNKENLNSIFFSYDMAAPIMFQKLIQRETGMDRKKVYEVFKTRNEKEISRITKLLEDNYKNVTMVFKSGQTIEEIKNTIIERENMLGKEIKLVVVDYLELIQSKFSDPTQASAEAIQGLREIANNLNKAVLVLLQPNKISSKPNEPLTSYNAAKGSSAIAQAVTAMVTAHRPGYSSRTPENDKFFSLDIVKNRMGSLFSVDYGWEGLTGRIRELDELEREELKQLREAISGQGDGDQNLF